MKRLHIHLNAEATQFEPSIAFYSALFDHKPTKRRPGYAQWKLDDPSVNFVVETICHDGDKPGIHHVGLETDSATTLDALRARLRESGAPLMDVGETTCCFARSDKTWAQGPDGLRWEAFRSSGDIDHYGAQTEAEAALCVAPPAAG